MSVTADPDAFFNLHMFEVGRVLTEQDVADIQKVLADFNDEIAKAVDAFHEGRMAAYRDIGGDALVAAVEARDDATVKAAIDKALARLEAAKCIERKDRT